MSTKTPINCLLKTLSSIVLPAITTLVFLWAGIYSPISRVKTPLIHKPQNLTIYPIKTYKTHIMRSSCFLVTTPPKNKITDNPLSHFPTTSLNSHLLTITPVIFHFKSMIVQQLFNLRTHTETTTSLSPSLEVPLHQHNLQLPYVKKYRVILFYLLMVE